MNKVEPDQCSSSLRQSIPWYLNGTLSESDAAQIRNHVEQCSDCRADVELHSSVQSAVLGREVTSMMPRTKAADIIRNDRATPARRARIFAMAAGVAVIGVALGLFFDSDQGTETVNRQFTTATSAVTGARIDYVLQIRFDDDVPEQQRGEIVARLDDVMKWSRDNNGVYEVHVQLATPSLATLEEYALHADSIPGVQSAEFTALQLPMR
jgi:hypothetical protein